ncbi:MAG: hypothetical protein RMJ46_02475 [Bacteroidota bacterium]|nr:hypothetical protein [Bacteroidota bacterium]
METRLVFQLAYSLKAYVRTAFRARGISEILIQLQGVQLAEQGRRGNIPAVLEHRECLPAGVDHGYCTLALGRRQQSFLLHFAPPRVVVLQHDFADSPIAELVTP